MQFIWDNFPGGNVEHVAENGLTIDEVEHVMLNSVSEGVSRSTGRPMACGYTPADEYAIVIFEWVDDETVLVVTAYIP